MATESESELHVYTLRANRDDLRRLTEIANSEHRTLAQEIRRLIAERIIEHDGQEQAA